MLTAGITTALSAAAIAATAAAQGIFSPADHAPAQPTAPDPGQVVAMDAQVAPAGTPIVRELPAIVIDGSTGAAVGSQAGTEATAPQSSDGDGRRGLDDGPLHDVGDDRGGLSDDDSDDDRSGYDDDDDDRHGGDDDDDDDDHRGDDDDDDDDHDRHGDDDDDD